MKKGSSSETGSIIENEDDEAEVEEDEHTDLLDNKEEEDISGEHEASPSADTTILFVKREDLPANNCEIPGRLYKQGYRRFCC